MCSSSMLYRYMGVNDVQHVTSSIDNFGTYII